MVETLPSRAQGVSSIPGQGTKIPHASWPKNQNMKNRSHIVTNSVKTLNMAHTRRLKKNKIKRIDSKDSLSLRLRVKWFPSLPLLIQKLLI